LTLCLLGFGALDYGDGEVVFGEPEGGDGAGNAATDDEDALGGHCAEVAGE